MREQIQPLLAHLKAYSSRKLKEVCDLSIRSIKGNNVKSPIIVQKPLNSSYVGSKSTEMNLTAKQDMYPVALEKSSMEEERNFEECISNIRNSFTNIGKFFEIENNVQNSGNGYVSDDSNNCENITFDEMRLKRINKVNVISSRRENNSNELKDQHIPSFRIVEHHRINASIIFSKLVGLAHSISQFVIADNLNCVRTSCAVVVFDIVTPKQRF